MIALLSLPNWVFALLDKYSWNLILVNISIAIVRACTTAGASNLLIVGALFLLTAVSTLATSLQEKKQMYYISIVYNSVKE